MYCLDTGFHWGDVAWRNVFRSEVYLDIGLWGFIEKDWLVEGSIILNLGIVELRERENARALDYVQ
jgi:hypothetical protein